MDINLDTFSTVYGSEQVKQTLTLLLRNSVGSFMQSALVGSYVGVHEPGILLEEGVKRTLEEVPYVSCKTVTVVDENIYVTITYKGDDITLKI